MTQTIYCYLRVSTEDQTIENSKLVIYDYLKKHGYDLNKVEWVCEKKSGYKYGYKDRKIGTDILPVIKKDDILLVSSMSRITRKLRDMLKFVEDEVIPKKFTLIIANNNMTIDDTPVNKLILSMLAMCAEFEIDIGRQRTKAGINRYRAEHNGKWGRPKGLGKRKLDPYMTEIKKQIDMGVTLGRIAKNFGVAGNTMYSFNKKYNLKGKRK